MLCAIIFTKGNTIDSPSKLANSQVQIYGRECELGKSAFQDWKVILL